MGVIENDHPFFFTTKRLKPLWVRLLTGLSPRQPLWLNKRSV